MVRYTELRSTYGLLHVEQRSLLSIRIFSNLPYFDDLIMYHDGTRTCYSLAVENLLMNLMLKYYTCFRDTQRARSIRDCFWKLQEYLIIF